MPESQILPSAGPFFAQELLATLIPRSPTLVPAECQVLATLSGKGDWRILQMKAWGLERWPDLVKVTQGGEEGSGSGLSGSCYHITHEDSP